MTRDLREDCTYRHTLNVELGRRGWYHFQYKNLLWLYTERELNPGTMADPPTGGPEPPPTNTQETQASFSVKDFQPRVSIDTGQIIGKRTRNGEAYTPAEGTGRITTREVWKLIDNLKDIIHHQTTLIESTKADLEEVKHDQNILQEQNDRLHEEVRALKAQIKTSPQPNPPRT